MKALSKLSVALGLALGITTIMAAPAVPVDVDNQSYFGVGVNSNSYINPSYNLNLTYVNNGALMDAFGSIALGKDNRIQHTVGGDIGLRSLMSVDGMNLRGVYATYGVSGAVFVDNKAANNPWLLGPFVGVDYQAIPHLLLSVKFLPYAYYEQTDSTQKHQIGGNGSFAVSYLF